VADVIGEENLLGDEEAMEVAAEPGLPGIEHTKACPAPSLARVMAYFGRPPDEDPLDCWFCQAARLDSTAISMRRMNEMVDMYLRALLNTDQVALVIQLAKFFEFLIRQPANAKLQAGQHAIPPQHPIQIYWHIRIHVVEASNVLFQRASQLKEAADTISMRQLYEKQYDSDGNLFRAVRPEMVKPWLAILKEERLMRKEQPERMFLYSAAWAITPGSVNGFVNVDRPFYLENMPAYALGDGSGPAQGQAPASRGI
jgi:hypothetical protein